MHLIRLPRLSFVLDPCASRVGASAVAPRLTPAREGFERTAVGREFGLVGEEDGDAELEWEADAALPADERLLVAVQPGGAGRVDRATQGVQ